MCFLVSSNFRVSVRPNCGAKRERHETVTNEQRLARFLSSAALERTPKCPQSKPITLLVDRQNTITVETWHGDQPCFYFTSLTD